MSDPAELFAVGEGVRRCIAAREAGLDHILATVYREGQPPRLQWIELDRLYSPKSCIHRFDRVTDLLTLVNLLRTAAGRAKMVAIGVEPVSPAAARRMTAIRDVLFLDEEPDHE